eukprot:TRINITY_DN31317_c0_g2_i1.p1 TRINITY_DN31317_c0_g2~~TRINITY_DN31317_c0_g2_i1.p1  ORF type:complete len:386 (-),score=64.75 TRINITY_DN31317_c0_g2_i1:221-1378(-)
MAIVPVIGPLADEMERLNAMARPREAVHPMPDWERLLAEEIAALEPQILRLLFEHDLERGAGLVEQQQQHLTHMQPQQQQPWMPRRMLTLVARQPPELVAEQPPVAPAQNLRIVGGDLVLLDMLNGQVQRRHGPAGGLQSPSMVANSTDFLPYTMSIWLEVLMEDGEPELGDGLTTEFLEKNLKHQVFRWPHKPPACGSRGVRDTCTACTVCISDFALGEECRQLPCEHIFHKDCIDQWLQRVPTCPMCKGPADRQPRQRSAHAVRAERLGEAMQRRRASGSPRAANTASFPAVQPQHSGAATNRSVPRNAARAATVAASSASQVWPSWQAWSPRGWLQPCMQPAVGAEDSSDSDSDSSVSSSVSSSSATASEASVQNGPGSVWL